MILNQIVINGCLSSVPKKMDGYIKEATVQHRHAGQLAADEAAAIQKAETSDLDTPTVETTVQAETTRIYLRGTG